MNVATKKQYSLIRVWDDFMMKPNDLNTDARYLLQINGHGGLYCKSKDFFYIKDIYKRDSLQKIMSVSDWVRRRMWWSLSM